MEPPLSRQVEARADVLVQSTLEALHQDPFWEARDGAERARLLGTEDVRAHVRHLVQSLDAHQPSIMESYVHSLRAMRMSRGLSTLHLDTHFLRLSAALEAQGWGPGTEPHEHVRVAREALHYPSGLARRLQEDAPELSHAATSRLRFYLTPEDLPRLEEELRLQLSYLADALDEGRPEVMADHVRWYVGFWPRRGFGLLAFTTVLGMLKAVLASRHPQARLLLATAGVSWEETRS
ncbi:hypothetical protein [Myxococcus landrumensis]|uniref:Uncharacterized protein n=1 Tax=Myxococcus landrumensis TaxID=2813577 RepID=A0ABX7N215_9BACT|nr:hypothetical protein [Myxococcus landrumus]QSQ11737.1 hypothetical protein JY572_25485 [Myxococcus landrumus]